MIIGRIGLYTYQATAVWDWFKWYPIADIAPDEDGNIPEDPVLLIKYFRTSCKLKLKLNLNYLLTSLEPPMIKIIKPTNVKIVQEEWKIFTSMNKIHHFVGKTVILMIDPNIAVNYDLNILELLFPYDKAGFRSCRDNFCDICCEKYFSEDFDSIKHSECSNDCDSKY